MLSVVEDFLTQIRNINQYATGKQYPDFRYIGQILYHSTRIKRLDLHLESIFTVKEIVLNNTHFTLLVLDLLQLLPIFNMLKLHLALLVLVQGLEVTQPPSSWPPIRVMNLVALAKVHVGRLREAKVLRHLQQVQSGHIENVLHVVSLVRSDVRLERQLAGLIQEVVLRQQIFQLQLNVGDLAPGELKFIQRNLCLLEVLEEGHLLRTKQQQSMATDVLAAGSTADPVNVFLGVIRWIVLHDPIDGRNIQTTSGHICTQQDTGFGVAKLEED